MANSANVLSAMPRTAGAVRVAPLGTDGPTDAETALDSAFIDLGYLGEDGITESIARDVDKKKAFGGATVRILQTSYDNTLSFVFMESRNADVLKRVYGPDNVDVDGDDITVRKNKRQLPCESWVIDVEDGDNLERIYVPEGQITEVGDIVRVRTDTRGYERTVGGFEGEVIDGDNSRTFLYGGALDPVDPEGP